MNETQQPAVAGPVEPTVRPARWTGLRVAFAEAEKQALRNWLNEDRFPSGAERNAWFAGHESGWRHAVLAGPFPGLSDGDLSQTAPTDREWAGRALRQMAESLLQLAATAETRPHGGAEVWAANSFDAAAQWLLARADGVERA